MRCFVRVEQKYNSYYIDKPLTTFTSNHVIKPPDIPEKVERDKRIKFLKDIFKISTIYPIKN